MNQITQLFRQLQAMFAGMNSQSRVLAILMLVAILISSAFLLQGYQTGSQQMEYLFDGSAMQPSELDRIEMAFSSLGLNSYERNGNRIRVPRATRSDYMKAINTAKITFDGLGGTRSTQMANGGILEPEGARERRMRDATIRALEDALKHMPEVADALITYDERKEGFTGEKKKTASVAIRPKGGISLSEVQKQSIISYIEKSFAGMRATDIVVFDLSTSDAYYKTDNPDQVANDAYLKTKMQYESYYKQKALDLLYPYGNVRVQVNAELDRTVAEETQELKYDNKPTIVETVTTKKDSDSKKGAPGGKPGTDPNAIANQSASLVADQSNKTKEQSDVGRGVVGNTLTSSKKAGLKLTNASFAVEVPFSYYRRAFLQKWQMQNPSQDVTKAPAITESDLNTLRTDTEANIRKTLTAILDKGTPGEDVFPRVTVNDYLDPPELQIAGPSIASSAMDWIGQSWQTVAMFVLAAIALVSLRSFAKTSPGGSDAPFERGFDIPLDDAADIDLSGIEDDVPAANEDSEEGPPSFKTTGSDLKQDLTTLVRSNPDAAATLLRSWISGGA